MNVPFFTGVNSFVHLNCMTLCLKFVTRALAVHSYFQVGHHCFLDKIDVWHETLNKICCDYFKADFLIPKGTIVIEWSIEDFKEFSMFSHVCIDNEDDETRIEELA